MRVRDFREREQIGPLTSEVGFPAPPEITFREVHNYDSAEGAD